MFRKNAINPRIMAILSHIPLHHPQEHISHEAEPEPAPTPPKKSWWGRAWDRIKDFGGRAMNAFERVSKAIAPIALVLAGAAKLINSVARYQEAMAKA